jgi:hypothetical protein
MADTSEWTVRKLKPRCKLTALVPGSRKKELMLTTLRGAMQWAGRRSRSR